MLRRLLRSLHVSGIVRDSIVALNSLCVGSDSAARTNSQTLTAAQADVIASLSLSAQRLGTPPEGLHGEGALKEPSQREVTLVNPGTSLPIDVDRLALPPEGFVPVPLAVLEEKNATVPDKVAAEKKTTSGVRRVYTDLGLRCPHRYLKLVRRLQAAGLVQYALDCECRVGMFAVEKKNGEQRLVLDCRYSSCQFSEPPKVQLASG